MLVTYRNFELLREETTFMTDLNHTFSQDMRKYCEKE